MDPLYDFKAILSGDDRNTGNTSDEVLQRHTALQRVVAQRQRAKFDCIALGKTTPKTRDDGPNATQLYFTFISDWIRMLTSALRESHRVTPANCGLWRSACSEP